MKKEKKWPLVKGKDRGWGAGYYVFGVEDAWAVQIVIATTPKPLDDDQNNYTRQRLGKINMEIFLLTPQ